MAQYSPFSVLVFRPYLLRTVYVNCFKFLYRVNHLTRGPLHKTFTGEKTLVKSENSGKHEFTIDFTTGTKLRLK